MSRTYVVLAIALLLALSTTPLAAAPLAAAPPNIVIILADDLGYGDPGCYNPDSKIPTPHIDQLAGQGMRFTDSHSPTAVCTPTRYALLTGRYCWRTRLKRGVLWTYAMPLLEPERLTMPEMLKEHGYATLCIGKWHLGMKWARKDGTENDPTATRIADEEIDLTKPITEGPLTAGFDYYFGTAVPNFPPYCFLENDHIVGPIPDRIKPKSMYGNPGRVQEGWQLDRILGGLADKATEKIAEHHTKTPDQPLFLYMPLTAPHTPISPSEAFRGKTEATLYGDFVAEVDHCVGRVMKALDEANMADNTLVVFTSDNGSPGRNGENAGGPTGSCFRDSGHNPSGPWRGMKSDIHEGGHRVPFIVRWPGKAPAGKTSDALICHVDLMATIAATLNHDLPQDCAEDSFCMLPLFRGEAPDKPIRETVVHHSGSGIFAVRAGDWKLIFGKGSGGFTKFTPPKDAPAGQLFNLADDPAEKQNLYEQRPEIVERLTGLKEKYVAEGRTRP